jgi:iron complex transport system permease protein
VSELKQASISRVTFGRIATPSASGAGGLLGQVPLIAQLLVLVVLIGVSAVVAIGLGPVAIGPARVASILADHFTGRPVDGPDAFIVWQLRVPRVIESVAVGVGLAISGAVVQALVRNPVADAYVLGLSSGAGVGAVLVLTMFGATAAGSLSLPAAAFVGALLSGVAVFAVARTQGRLQAGRLVMVGIAVGHLLSGVTSFLVLRANTGDAAQQVMFWLLGSLSGAQWPLARMSASIVTVLTVLLWVRAGRLNLLALGDDTASALGMHPTRARTGFFVLTALLVGAVVAVSGAIGFVGLVVPNLARLLVGADHRRVLPLCAALGALLLLWADTAARLLLSPTEVPIGILTAVVGVPFFVLAVRRGPSGQVGL